MRINLPKIVVTDFTEDILSYNLSVIRRHFRETYISLPPMPYIKQCLVSYLVMAINYEISSKQTRGYIDIAAAGFTNYLQKIDEASPAEIFEWIFMYLAVMEFVFDSFYDLGIKDFHVEPLDSYIVCVLEEGFSQEQVWLDCFTAASGDLNVQSLNPYEPIAHLCQSLMYTKDQPQCCFI